MSHNEKKSKDKLDPECSWIDHERMQLLGWIEATPRQRLDWLEEAIKFAHQAGALKSTKE